MYNSEVFEKTEKLPLTKIVKILKEAHTKVFTVNFNCKVDEKEVQHKLKRLSPKDFKNTKALAKDIFVGKEKTIVGRLSKSENHLGRSLVIDFHAGNRGYA